MTNQKKALKNICALISSVFLIQLAPQALAKDYETSAAYEKKITHVNINKDGSFEEIEEYTILIKSQQAVDGWSQADIAFSSDHQTLEILEAYTITPDGKKIKVADNAIRTVEDELSSGAAMFSDVKYKVIIFPNVTVGARIYYKTKLTAHTPSFPNHFVYSQHFSPMIHYDQVEMNFTYPKTMAMRVETRKLTSQRTETNNSISYKFVFQQPKVRLKESAQVSLIDFAPALYLSTFKDYLEYGQAYEVRAKDKAVVTKNVQQLANDITKDKNDRKAQARALYNWVSKEIRYVAIYMGNGGVVPHAADDIIRNRYGDCKDKNTLLIALLNAKGIQASSALINSGNAYTLPIIPVFSPFNHVITYLPEWDLYVDATQDLAPFGELGDHIAGKTTLLTGLNKMGQTPKLTPENNGVVTHVTVVIKPNGDMEGNAYSRYRGHREIAARYKFEGYTSTNAESMVIDQLYRFRQTGTGQFIPTNVYNLDQAFELKSEFKLDSITNFPGPGAMSVPIGLAPGSITLISFNKPKDKLLFPYECTSGHIEENTIINFPINAKLTRIPKSTKYEEDGTSYTSSYKKTKANQLEVKRTLITKRPGMVCQPEELERWKNMHAAIKKDLRSQIFYE